MTFFVVVENLYQGEGGHVNGIKTTGPLMKKGMSEDIK